MAKVLSPVKSQVQSRNFWRRKVLTGIVGSVFGIVFAYRWPALAGAAVFLSMGLPEAWRAYRKHAKTAKGEETIAGLLRTLPKSFVVVNDLPMYDGNGKRIRVDHLVVGPRGAMILQTHEEEGHFVQNDDQWFRIDGTKRQSIASMSEQARHNAEAISLQLKVLRLENKFQAPLSLLRVLPVVVFANDRVTLRTTQGDVTVLTKAELQQFILGNLSGQGITEKEALQIGRLLIKSRDTFNPEAIARLLKPAKKSEERTREAGRRLA